MTTNAFFHDDISRTLCSFYTIQLISLVWWHQNARCRKEENYAAQSLYSEAVPILPRRTSQRLNTEYTKWVQIEINKVFKCVTIAYCNLKWLFYCRLMSKLREYVKHLIAHIKWVMAKLLINDIGANRIIIVIISSNNLLLAHCVVSTVILEW